MSLPFRCLFLVFVGLLFLSQLVFFLFDYPFPEALLDETLAPPPQLEICQAFIPVACFLARLTEAGWLWQTACCMWWSQSTSDFKPFNCQAAVVSRRRQ